MFDEICAAVDEAFETQIEALTQLVDQPSHTYAKEDVDAAAAIVDGLAQESGLSVAMHDPNDDRFAHHRVYKTSAVGQVPCLALVGHIDTVFPRSSGFLKFSRVGEKAFGPGVLDMKSGLTTILFALRAFRTVAPDSFQNFPVQFICVSDEEVGSPSSRNLYKELAPTIKEALVFEKGRDEDRIITSRKGGGSFRIDVEGKAVHAGNHHEKGVNAVHALALLVPKLEAMTDYDRGITINVGVFEGGTAKNTVPQHAHCIIDARFVTAEDAREFSRRLQTLLEEPMPGRLANAKMTFTGDITRPPMEATQGNRDLAERYGRFAESVGLKKGEAPRQGGFSDSNLIAAHDIAVVDGLGAFGNGAHSHDEWCDLASLRRRTKALALFLAAQIG